MKLLIIEAPGKLKKLKPMMKKLRPGEDWEVVASGGHIRDLPAKGQGDTLITTGVGKDLMPVYEILDKSARTVRALKAAAKQASEIYLATDPDREGESISWHIQQVLRLNTYKRITFSEITDKRVAEALANPRQIDLNRVASQECRRVLDRLVGYLVTQELRRLMGKPTSAGRVQSPAVYLVVLRERAIRNFQVINHFGVRLYFLNITEGTYWHADWQPVPDFANEEFPYVQDSSLAQLMANIRNVVVQSCEDRQFERHPPAPFISSTLQQAASNALKWDPDKTMQVAQRLYEQGVITYHRTDNPNVPDEAMEEIRAVASALGVKTVDARRLFKAAEGAQEGHPAITPTDWMDRNAGENDDELDLYRLIWTRALASQLEAAVYDVRTAMLLGIGPQAKTLNFTAKGRTLRYPGWLKLLKADDTDDEQDAEASNPVPALSPKQILSVHSGELLQKKTQSPPRYTKASLIKEMERRGIGRPSTFASILKNITSKGLIEEKSRKLVPAPLGEETISKLEGFFSFLELDFTRELERDLDRIALGQDTYGVVVARLYQRLEGELSKQRGLPSVGMSSSFRTAQSTTLYTCTKCQQPLVRRQKKGDGGYDFWGCTGFKSNGCKVSYPTVNDKPNFDKSKGM
ncbi:type I DNA topoisomerase [Pseudomonas fluorescens]|uniref:DNA topoisomerase 1 n=1 Tax=Pseudomonas fluorescens TaxID=294 RepID=A0A4Y9TJC1_PSEFL|nr:type I DNA topoisomerase [Pseudomonas fluorescens]TFW43122.1 type I DNA topoisomerase [Pseudomonas fluorescens]